MPVTDKPTWSVRRGASVWWETANKRPQQPMLHQPFDWIVMTTGHTGYTQRFSYITGLARAFSERIPTVYVNPAIGWYQAWIKREPRGVLADLSSERLKVFQPYTWRNT